MNNSFTVFPAIDLHLGQVVRLMQGDLGRQTQYKNTPADTAKRWISTRHSMAACNQSGWRIRHHRFRQFTGT